MPQEFRTLYIATGKIDSDTIISLDKTKDKPHVLSAGKFRTETFDLFFDALPYNKLELLMGDTSMSGFTMTLKRNPSPFFTNTYLPTGLLTIMSFIGFVIPIDMVPGRMALLVTIFLMLVNISSTERNKGPMVREIYYFSKF